MQNQTSRAAGPNKDGKARDSAVAIYSCVQEKEYATPNQQGAKVQKKVNIDVFIVISESVFLVIEPDAKMKGIGRLVSWGTLPTIDKISRNLDKPDHLTIAWRKVDYKEPWVLSIVLMNNGEECIQLIRRHLTKLNLEVKRMYKEMKKLQESEVTAEGYLKQQ